MTKKPILEPIAKLALRRPVVTLAIALAAALLAHGLHVTARELSIKWGEGTLVLTLQGITVQIGRDPGKGA